MVRIHNICKGTHLVRAGSLETSVVYVCVKCLRWTEQTCVCMCVCVREREREGESQREREIKRRLRLTGGEGGNNRERRTEKQLRRN